MEDWRVLLLLVSPFLFFALGWTVRTFLSTVGIQSHRPLSKETSHQHHHNHLNDSIGTVSATTTAMCGSAALSSALLAPYMTPVTLTAAAMSCFGVGAARVGSGRHSFDQILAGIALGLFGTLCGVFGLHIIGLNI